ncbi:MAG: hypothetical protein OXC02_08645 [Rhodobacteraceae bacterium]|nr:hypothetical protein [Paracoccaceae bacterium]
MVPSLIPIALSTASHSFVVIEGIEVACDDLDGSFLGLGRWFRSDGQNG